MQLLCQYLHSGFPHNSKLSGNLRQYRALANELYEQDCLLLYNNRIVIPVGPSECKRTFCFASTMVTWEWTNACLLYTSDAADE